MSARKPCGVCTRRSWVRSHAPRRISVSPAAAPEGPAPSPPAVSISSTPRPLPGVWADSFATAGRTVSVIGRTGTTASAPERTAVSTRRNTSGGVRQRAASWTSTNSTSPTYFKAICTDEVRSLPPATAVIDIPLSPFSVIAEISSRARTRNSSGATTTTAEATPEESIASRLRVNRLRPFTRTKAFGSSPPRRVPDPAAARMTQVLRMRALRPAEPLPRTLPSSQPGRVRTRGSDAPSRACASLLSTGRGPARGARGHGRPRRP